MKETRRFRKDMKVMNVASKIRAKVVRHAHYNGGRWYVPVVYRNKSGRLIRTAWWADHVSIQAPGK